MDGNGTKLTASSSGPVLPIKRPSGIYVHVDDWSGRKERAERRKIQNRLNQRAHSEWLEVLGPLGYQLIYCNVGKRKESALRPQQLLEYPAALSGPAAASTSPFLVIEYAGTDEERRHASADGYLDYLAQRSPPSEVELYVRKWMCSRVLRRMQLDNSARQTIIRLETAQPLQPPSTYCPLPADHLLTLVYYNVMRACVSNILCMGLDPGLMCDEVLSPFNLQSTRPPLPPDLQPTVLQLGRGHHPYIDIFPSPVVRDNLLRAGEEFDNWELWKDVTGIDERGYVDNATTSEFTGLLVWGEPWDVQSWEVSEGFSKKWAWLLKGCEELSRSTNYWRRRRGEEDLIIEL